MASKLESMFGKQPETKEDLTELKNKFNRLPFKRAKILKATDGRAAVMVSPDLIDISAPDRDNEGSTIGIRVMSQTGTLIRGPIGLSASPSEIRIAGLWKFNDLLLSAAPSTIMTPIPVLRFSLPLTDIPELIGTVTALGAIRGLL